MAQATIRKIFLLDDEPSVAHALTLLLKALGYTVECSSQPLEALMKLQSAEHFDLFLCDLRMPRLNGLSMLKESRTLRPDLPVILMSAHASTAELAQAREAGLSGFLAKPFTPTDLAAIMNQLQNPQ